MTTTSFFQRDGFDLAYSVFGQGIPCVLVHGFASTAQVNWHSTGWPSFLCDLGYQVVTFDNRGHGASAKFYEPQDYTLDSFSQDLEALLDHLSIERCVLMGYSMGARIAATFSIHHLHRVDRLILGGLAGNMLLGLAQEQTAAIIEALLAPSLDLVSQGGVGWSFRKFAEQTKSDLAALAACLQSSREKISPKALARVNCPTLIVFGDRDEIAGEAAPLLEVIPRSKAIVLPGLDHMKTVGSMAYKQAVRHFLKEMPFSVEQ